ncbi:MAG: FAD-dependent oxidoreductase [Pseudomonadota bacterium]
MESFSLLFSPIKIGEIEIKNRIVMAPMTTGYASDDGGVNQTLIDFYQRRANGGVGLIVCESCYVEKGGKGFIGQMSIEDDKYIPGLTRLTQSVKSAGAKIVLQLIHCGRQASSALCGGQPVAPSPIPCPVIQEMPRELSTEEITGIVERFVDAAQRAKEAGFDGVEVHAAHGYLLNQFLSAYSNRRKDAYGGDLFNRSRILVDIVSKIKKRLGADYPVLCRISADEFVRGGLTLSDTTILAGWLQNIGLDAISVSGGVYETAYRVVPTMDMEQGSLVHLAAGIKQSVNLPIFAVGGIYDAAFADRILVEGMADMVAIGRTLLADPEWPAKVMRGEHDRIRPCIYCNHCRNRAIRPKVNCAVNYETGRETELTKKGKRSEPKRVVVIGGGISGMEAAYVCSQRGHAVTLYERTQELGGNLRLASIPPKRGRLLRIIAFLEREIVRLGVKVILGTQPTLEEIRGTKPDVVLLATGSEPILPDIPGLDGPNVHLAERVLRGQADVGKSVVVIGGGLVGLETADYLREQGKAVTIIDKLPQIASDPRVEAIFKRYLLDRLTSTSEQVLVLTSTEVKEVGQGYVRIENALGERIIRGIDSVVIAAGFKGCVPIAPKELGPECEVHVIGDAVKPQTLFEAIHSAAQIAYSV